MWRSIDTAPRDGAPVLLRNAEFSPPYALGWNSKAKRWEGVAFCVARAAPIWWDEKASQPTEWFDHCPEKKNANAETKT